MFRGKDLSQLDTARIFYFHVIRMLRAWKVWEPELLKVSEPVW